MPTLTPTTADAFYGSDAHQRYDHYKHPVRTPGGNPVLIWRHGGGWKSRDKRMISPTEEITGNRDESNILADALLSGRVPFDVISIETRQARWETSTTTAAFGYSEPHTVATYYPEAWRDFQRAIIHIKANAQTLDINPDMIIAGGSSAGACMALWSQIVPPMTAGGFQESTNVRYVGSNLRASNPDDFTRGLDSRVRGVWFHLGIPDFRKTNSGTESVATSGWYSVFGTENATAAGTVSTAAREAISPLSYVERGTPYWVPTYGCYAQTRPVTTPCNYTASSGAIVAVSGTPFLVNDGMGNGGFGYQTYQAGDYIVCNAGSAPLTGRTDSTTITVAANALGRTDGVIDGQIFYGKPFGTATGRDIHAQEQGETMARECAKRGYPFGLEIYGTFQAAPSVAWMYSVLGVG